MSLLARYIAAASTFALAIWVILLLIGLAFGRPAFVNPVAAIAVSLCVSALIAAFDTRVPSWLRLLLVLAVIAALMMVPLSLGRYGIYILSLWLVTAVAAMGVNLIVGYAGQETLAQAAFLGIGAYTTALMTKAGMPFAAAVLASGLAAFVVGIVLGFPALRVQKHYLAFVTLAFSVFVWLVIRNEEWLTGGVSGLANITRPSLFGLSLRPALYFYWFTLAVAAALTFAMWWLLRSPWGRAFTALRENPMRAESLGVDVRGYTLLAFAIGSAYGGFAGALYAPLVEFIDPAPFALGPSLLFLLMVVIGGAGSFVGPFIGAAVAVLLPEWLRFAESYYLIVYAVLVMLMMAFCPSGIVGLVERLTTRKRQPHADDKGAVLEEAKS
jgi:branched-chain amino acid transport system permease protein